MNSIMYHKNTLLILLIGVCFSACQTKENTDAVGVDGWLKGTTQEKLHELANQQAGTGRAMIEVGYRYQELYWAGAEGNWEYAEHQLEEIEITLQLALVRRPERATSAQAFLNYSIPEMEKVIETTDTIQFLKAFTAFTAGCNACHIAEKMPFLHVEKPIYKLSPIRTPRKLEIE